MEYPVDLEPDKPCSTEQTECMPGSGNGVEMFHPDRLKSQTRLSGQTFVEKEACRCCKPALAHHQAE